MGGEVRLKCALYFNQKIYNAVRAGLRVDALKRSRE